MKKAYCSMCGKDIGKNDFFKVVRCSKVCSDCYLLLPPATEDSRYQPSLNHAMRKASSKGAA